MYNIIATMQNEVSTDHHMYVSVKMECSLVSTACFVYESVTAVTLIMCLQVFSHSSYDNLYHYKVLQASLLIIQSYIVTLL